MTTVDKHEPGTFCWVELSTTDIAQQRDRVTLDGQCEGGLELLPSTFKNVEFRALDVDLDDVWAG